jgi:putative peptide zinc metalloprotease protein
MNRIRRLLLVSVLGLAVAASSPAGLRAQETEDGTGPDTAAVAINTKDGSTVFRVAFMIIRNSGDVVDNTNIAFAYSSCESCKTIAASFQVVLVTGDPSVASPENYAIAINFECTDCQTLASAYQFAQSTDGQVVFTPEGQQEIADIRQELNLLMRNAESMTIFEIQAELDALAQRLAEVLANELVTVSPDLRLEIRGDDVDEGAEVGEPTETPSVDTGTTSPSETDSPSPTETSSPTETVSVSPSPTSTG